MLGVAPETLRQLVQAAPNALSDKKVRDILHFAVKCSRNPQSLTDEDYETLRQHGLKQSEIVELIAMSALAVYANIIADATAMEADEMFSTI
jgi:alkylhydroperoxidase family enzyme